MSKTGLALSGARDRAIAPSVGQVCRRGHTLLWAVLLAMAAVPTFAAQAEKDVTAKEEAELERKLADARKRLDAAAREVAELSMSLSESVVPHMRGFAAGGPHRALLGINLGRRDARGEGIEIVSVSPGGAAEQAGLKAGDVLLEIGGISLKREGERSPREKLLAAMREVQPGESVAVTYRRDGKALKADLTAQALGERPFTMPLPGRHDLGALAHLRRFGLGRAEGVFGSAELVAMTPKLGQYFGTESGLLVVRAPQDSRLKLEDGDVIVEIDGRVPASPAHALRILSSYQSGEKLQLNVLRARKRIAFEITIPEDPWEQRLEDARFSEEDVLMYTPLEATPVIPAAPARPGTI